MRVDNSLADGVHRWEVQAIQTNLTKESPQTVWQCRSWGGKSSECVRRFDEMIRLRTGCDVDKKDVRAD